MLNTHSANLIRIGFRLDPWFITHLVGITVVTILIFVKRPKDFPMGYLSFVVATPIMIAAGFFGARLFYAVLHATKLYGSQDFWQRLNFGGFGHLGALAAVTLVLVFLSKVRFKPVSFLKVADYITPFLFVEQAIGRIGCFMVGCCYGCPTDLPWGVVFRNVGPIRRHPAQLYYFIFIMAVFFISRHLYKKNLPAGVVFFSTFTLYGFFRFFGEFVRVDSPVVFAGLKLSQLGMIAVFLFGAIGMLLTLKRRKV